MLVCKILLESVALTVKTPKLQVTVSQPRGAPCFLLLEQVVNTSLTRVFMSKHYMCHKLTFTSATYICTSHTSVMHAVSAAPASIYVFKPHAGPTRLPAKWTNLLSIHS